MKLKFEMMGCDEHVPYKTRGMCEETTIIFRVYGFEIMFFFPKALLFQTGYVITGGDIDRKA